MSEVKPPYYKGQNGIECKDAMVAMLGKDGYLNFCEACVLKYIWRWRGKDGVKSLKKAREYLDYMIGTLEADQEKVETIYSE